MYRRVKPAPGQMSPGPYVSMYAYKLLTKRKDGTLGPLFINRPQRIPIGVWVKAESHPTKGYAVRPGWHVTLYPYAPHLSRAGRVWCWVQIEDYYEYKRPDSQGGVWYIANWMRIMGEVLGGSTRDDDATRGSIGGGLADLAYSERSDGSADTVAADSTGTVTGPHQAGLGFDQNREQGEAR